MPNLDNMDHNLLVSRVKNYGRAAGLDHKLIISLNAESLPYRGFEERNNNLIINDRVITLKILISRHNYNNTVFKIIKT